MQLQYDISVIGMAKVNQALATIERRFAQHNSRMSRELGGGVGGGLSVAARRSGTAGAGRVPLGVQFGPNRAQLEKAAGAEQHRKIMGQIRAEERARVAAARAATRAEKERLAAMRKGFVEMSKAAQAADRQERRVAAAGKRSFARGTMGALTGAASTVAGIGKAGLALTGISGGAAAGIAISTEMRERAKASQLANQAGNPALKGQLLQDARGVRGFTGEEALGGMEAFVTKTGDLATARNIIGDLGQLSLATGANLEDLGETAGQAFNVLRDQIADPKQQLIELKGIMGALAQQGNMGAVEIKDLAKDFGKLGAATRGFEGGAPALLRTMGAFAQIAVARGGAESSADASTAAARMVGDIVTNKKKFKKLGVGIKSKLDPTKLRDPLDIMQDVLAKTGGDVEKTSGLFGIESAKIFKGLAATYSEAEKKKKGSGRAAVDAEFKRFAGANLDDKALKERAASRMSDPDVQFKETMKGLNAALAKELLPVAIMLGTKLKEATPAIGKFAQKLSEVVMWLAENPWKGIGLLVAASIGKEIAAAQIKSLIERLITGGGKGGVGGSGGLSSGGAMAATAAVAGVSLAVDQAGKLQKETGMRGSVLDVLPGMKGGKFDAGSAALDLINPLAMGTKVAGFTTEAMMKATGSEMKAGARAGSNVSTRELASRQLIKLDGAEKIAQAGEKMIEAANKMATSGPNRSDAPTTPTK